ncbi:MAG: tRNA (5-methylaminomethyl-2-thiouridine)(34)-methyltransferase MnmD [Deltaproteobacteria bacterium]|jgi:tRNA U34 5-methylaminomethyl-2-thiouridine-forming methyltransferase MnmC|nr:tRNA (5-methylaminomethyl-2-thiouridine)(34)-methyltransferase MnmD [Deltaproteobacteria bacterium]MBT6436317.1 tRNA (5-methylaminomethyl-2-thiouridine)(34)-methyltransferase MnmD [Deltaproteobacteria bacterium]MBT6488149.1 tRNA (5-methylaminomethyl-2-thiouridine)(34)-methyltransferase MnmD [Deltaproteobacteria bacterium]
MNNVDASEIQIDALEIESTLDGSSTLIDRATGITYRSLFGAYTESTYVFVEGSRVFSKKGPWNILEFGLGGGSNLMSTLKRYRENHSTAALHYHAIERAPVLPAIAQELHKAHGFYSDLELLLSALNMALEIPKQPLFMKHPSLNITLTLWLGDFRRAKLPRATFDAVYHDPFDPRVNPDGWTDAWFSAARHAMKDDGILTTYSAATPTRRAMAKAGLHVGIQPGVGGKREMTGASPNPKSLQGYKLLPAHKQPGATR